MICLVFLSFEWMVEKVKTVRQLKLGDYMWAFGDGLLMGGKDWRRDYFLLQPHSPSTVGKQALPLEQRHLRDSEISSRGHFKVNPSQGGYPYRRWIVLRDLRAWKVQFRCKLGSCQDPAHVIQFFTLWCNLLHTLTWIICNQDRSLVILWSSASSTSAGIIQIQDRCLAGASPEAARMSQSAL